MVEFSTFCYAQLYAIKQCGGFAELSKHDHLGSDHKQDQRDF